MTRDTFLYRIWTSTSFRISETIILEIPIVNSPSVWSYNTLFLQLKVKQNGVCLRHLHKKKGRIRRSDQMTRIGISHLENYFLRKKFFLFRESKQKYTIKNGVWLAALELRGWKFEAGVQQKLLMLVSFLSYNTTAMKITFFRNVWLSPKYLVLHLFFKQRNFKFSRKINIYYIFWNCSSFPTDIVWTYHN
jgi:hypothetical protein